MGDRALVLSRLAAEKKQAEWCYEYERAAELGEQIRRLSAGAAGNPSKENTSDSGEGEDSNHRGTREETGSHRTGSAGRARKPAAR